MQSIPYFSDLPMSAWIGFSAFVGLFIGSFLNVVIARLPIMLERQWKIDAAGYLDQEEPKYEVFNLNKPASCCPKCKHAIKPWFNIPVLAYLVLGGKCHDCKMPISIRYPAVEILTAILFGLQAYTFGASYVAVFGMILVSFLIALTFIDADTQLLPDVMTLPLLWIGLIMHATLSPATLSDAVWGAIAGYLVLWTIFHIFKLLTGKEGMGYGDFKLLAALGAWVGVGLIPLIILMSSVVGAVLGILLIIIQGRDKAAPLPFGPYLAIAGLITWLWGRGIIDWYLGIV